ncbi:MAG TPA: sporulation protein YqfC, partial [Bacilli bacterium]|nr:sporulation protein YqfC [Bacilli bacterium]
MIGQLHLYIENHRGVLRFSQQELRLLLAKGQLLIKGEQFVIKSILPEELLLEGKIDSVLYLDD